MMKEKIFQNRLNESLNRFRVNTAIEYGSRKMTYEEFDGKSNSVSNWIVSKGIKKETFIGVLMEDRMELITVLIGIIKAGCVIVPLYSGYPNERIKTMVHETHLKYIFIDRENARRFGGGGDLLEEDREFIFIDEFYSRKEVLALKGRAVPSIRWSPEDRLYIYFTSGTTGTPRAVIGKNKSLLHFIDWEIETFNINSDFRVSQFTIPGFDPFLRDIFVPLISGGAICIPGNEEILFNSEELVDWIDKRRINLIHCVSSLFRLMSADWLTPDHFNALMFILLAGEKTNPADLVHWYDIFGERIQLVNCYGPTETTLSKVYYLIKPPDIHRERIPIGKPMKGCRVIILDERMEICDPLEVGEIYIRTPYRSHGYYNAPALNKERFIPNPFNNDPNDILYKSGDLGRFLLDGNIDILGRVDRQVKIRGYRVELEEIETRLSAHPAIKEAVVIKIETPGNNEMLCAYIATREEKEGITAQKQDEEAFRRQLREYLLERVPDYMVPASIIKLEKIPRGVSGKVDFGRLPDPLEYRNREYVPPRSHIQGVLAKLWSEILGIEKVGINDRFIELGGNSINVMALISRIHQEFEVKIPFGEMFNNSTLEIQARFVKEAKEERFVSVRPVETREYYALSSAQRRLYIMQQMNLESAAYNIQRIMMLEGKPDGGKLENVFAGLIKRHEILRTSFASVEGQPVQKVDDNAEFAIEYYRIGPDEVENTIEHFIRAFDLSTAPLFRIGVGQTGEGKHILMVDMHHIITDLVSINVLIRDFAFLYEDMELPGLILHYKDFSQWTQLEEIKKSIAHQKDYWLEQFAGNIPRLDLPTDYPRPEVKTFEGERIRFVIGSELALPLKKLVKETETTMFMVLLAAYNILLSRYGGGREIVVGSPITGRRHADLQGIIGMFVNMLSLKNYPLGSKTFPRFLEEVKQNALDAYENQDYQFEELIADLNLKGVVNRNPLFDVVFSMGIVETGERPPGDFKGLRDLKLGFYGFEKKVTPFDLLMGARDMDNRITMFLEYSSRLFKRETVEQMISHYIEILKQLVENRDIELKDIQLSYHLVELAAGGLLEEEGDFGF
jgi:amino acid adenylation domain-containing protein